jgi:glutamate formiminotransferase/formiminotetrahydrofolate cyclodeaminase
LSFDPKTELQKLIECVPNFSEGRDPEKIRPIVDAVHGVPNATVLHIDSNPDVNRTVLTFAGPPEAVLEAGFQMISKAIELIDMSSHKGKHPRIGAVDVFPFVPLKNSTLSECVGLAVRLGKRIGEELQIPIYLYEAAARKPERRNLSNIRSGGYEGLAEKISKPEWKPDFGPAEFHSKSGAAIIGARNILIAYNVNFDITGKTIAIKIAESIRESGGLMRDASGNPVRDAKGQFVRIPGKFKACNAIAWILDYYKKGRDLCRGTQVSTNLTDYKITPPHAVYQECVRLAETYGVRVTGSEIVGLVPLDAILMAGRHFIGKNKARLSEAELIDAAIKGLGLNDFYPFIPEEKILEYQMNRIEKQPDNQILQLKEVHR